MIDWRCLLEERSSFSIPSNHHQTLLAKAVFEHLLHVDQVAVVALASKSIQNSSLSANFAHNIIINAETVQLFKSVFHPSSSLPLQFVPKLHIQFDRNELQSFVQSLKETKYFHKSLRWVKLCSLESLDFFRSSQQFDHLEQIHLHFSLLIDELSHEDASLMKSSNFPRLESITCDHNSPDDSFISTVCTHFDKMTSLTTLQAILLTDQALQSLRNSPKLTTLRMASARQFTEVGISENIPLLTALTSLDLSCCENGVTDDSLAVIAQSLQNVTSLSIYRCDSVSNEGLRIISLAFPLLKNLDLASCGSFSVSDIGIQFLSSAESQFRNSLVSLKVSACENITNDGVKYICEFQNLEVLNLGSCVVISDEGIANLSSLSRLRELNLWGLTKLTDESLKVLGSLKLLQDLNVAYCESIRFCAADIPQFPNLTALDLGGVERNEFDVFLANVASSCPVLKSLTLSHLVDSAVVHLGKIPSLQKLNLGGCVLLTNEAVGSILSLLPYLTNLDISWNQQLTDDLLVEHGSAFGKLGCLSLSGCRNISQKATQNLRSKYRYLIVY